MKRLAIVLACAALPLAPASAQLGAPGVTDWAKTPQPKAVSPFPPEVPEGRAHDYVSIVNLLNTYFIALDAGDLDTYAQTFAPDAVMYWAGGVERGREAIYENLKGFGTGRKKLPADATFRPRMIHIHMNQRIDFTGPDTAHDVGMWLGVNHDVEGGPFFVSEFGHYEDKYVKIDGRWYIQERRILNERIGNRALFYPEMGEADPREK
ncbi:nuclear transport factor 2 family protein [Tsuneonella sp. HG222]